MHIYVLIWWIAFGGALTGGQQQFDSQAACLNAYNKMATMIKPGSTTLHGVCVPRGDL